MDSRNKLEKLALEYVKEGKQAFFDRKLNEAALSMQAAINIFKETGNMKEYVRSLNLIGVIYAALGNETMAIDFYLEGLECVKQNNLRGMALPFYNNIGSRYMELNEYDRAISYFKQAENELERSEVQSEERYQAWLVVTCLNLMSSYTYLEDYEKAKIYLEKATPYLGEDVVREHGASFMVAQYKLYWAMGKKELVYEHLEKFLDDVLKNVSASDHVQNMLSVCDLLSKMEEYKKWKRVIDSFEFYAREQKSVYAQLVLAEMWMDYYKAINDMEKYVKLCVEHAELYRKQKIVEDKERAAAIDLKIQLQEKEAERRAAEQLSFVDSLTKLGNRYKLKEDSYEMQIATIRKQTRMVVGVLDIDCFKEHNDTYGHLQGDDTLQKLAEVFELATEGVGMAYRFGGDEFVILMQDVTVEQVYSLANKIKELIAQLHIENKNSKILPEITISQGYYCFMPKKEQTLEEILAKADKALYYVKEHGRNQYRIIEEA